jgi:hypothetical protein
MFGVGIGHNAKRRIEPQLFFQRLAEIITLAAQLVIPRFQCRQLLPLLFLHLGAPIKLAAQLATLPLQDCQLLRKLGEGARAAVYRTPGRGKVPAIQVCVNSVTSGTRPLNSTAHSAGSIVASRTIASAAALARANVVGPKDLSPHLAHQRGCLLIQPVFITQASARSVS